MNRTLQIGKDVRIELLLDKNNEWSGIGDVQIGTTPLRDGTRPWMFRIDTPDGYLYTRYRLLDVKEKARGAVQVKFNAQAIPWGRQEYCDEYSQPLVHFSKDLQPVEDQVSLLFRPVAQTIGGRNLSGFSVALSYRSTSRKIHRILSDTTWELGGSILGNTVLSQGQCNMPVYRGKKTSLFTTTCLKTLAQHDNPQGVSYQVAPRGGLVQAFDFQWRKAGALVHYWPESAPISSVLESPKGSTRLHVMDEYRFTLAKKVTTTPQHILLCSDTLREEEARDLWWHAHELANTRIRAAHGVEPTCVRPEMDLDAFPRWKDGELLAPIGSGEYAPCDVLDAFAEELLPRYAELGVKRAMVMPINESDVTQGGLVRKIDQGVHGDWFCGSICCTHRYFPAAFWGGIKAWKRLARAAHKLGIEIGVWTSPHLSPRAEILKKHPDWVIRGSNSLTMGGGYGPALATMNWNSPAADWMLRDLKRWKQEGGLDYIFVDSWANCGLLCPNYADNFKNNLHPLGTFYGLVQKAGIRSISFEGISPFGYSRFGMADLRNDALDATQGIVGQNDYAWWSGNEDMACNLTFHLKPRKRTQEDIAQIRFRLMAARGGVFGKEMWDTRMTKIYEQVLPDMQTRTLLPNGRGICWKSQNATVYWIFKNTELAVPTGARIDVIDECPQPPVANNGLLHAKPMHVYRVNTPKS